MEFKIATPVRLARRYPGEPAPATHHARTARPLAAALLLLCTALPVGAADIYVDDDSACTTGCGAASSPYPSLQQALDAAVDGDTVRVQAGNYAHDNFLSKSVSIVGNGAARILVPTRGTGLRVTAGTGMEISGLDFVAADPVGGFYESGLSVSTGVDQLTIRDNRFSDMHSGAIVGLNRGVVTLEGNTFSGNVTGLSISLSYYLTDKTVTVRNNTFTANDNALSGGASPQAEKLFVYHNNFIDNVRQEMPYGAQVPDYLTGGNYWSHLAGVDSNLDGVNDQPYGTDFYPVPVADGWQNINPALPIHNLTRGVRYALLGQAVADALEGDVIELDGGDITGAGRYYEPVVLNKGITLRSNGLPATLHPAHNLPAVHIQASNVTLQGLVFKGFANTSRYPVGLSMANFLGSTFDNVNVLNSRFEGLYQGIAFTMSKGSMTIDGNVFEGNTHGLYYSMRYYLSAKLLTVTNNRFEANTTAVSGNASPQAEKVLIYHNNFINNANQTMPRGAQVPAYATGGNYWSNLTPEDVNGDGVIDQPYGTDFYPVPVADGWNAIVPVNAIHNRIQGTS